MIVNEKDKELDLANDDVDDDDDDFDFNEDISNEDVEKLVQSITANELDSGEVRPIQFLLRLHIAPPPKTKLFIYIICPPPWPNLFRRKCIPGDQIS